ncbi:CDK5 regulatory subunit-associated protein 3 isoform X2 [Pungitius pungitius]|uniref:CDK5 regulatory subunit-associated protein 3 isoform X2 n=1 Tax=Pungitius pungitius TaxID=134920 RepID=UPI0018878435|nr:CDK5 regulatory subunit-associated protein 3 isoform X2 [Pungitius pungitius]
MENIQSLPIDIQTGKLLDWLLDRRHCNLKWQTAVKDIREKINAAIQDMPENEEIKHLLSGSYIHYFHCLRIVEILKGTEASSKNIFGRYSSQRMKDWQEIISLYETDNIYLAEVASLLSRNVSYEGPALRKQLAKAQQLQQELSRREVECQSSAADLRERYYAACKQYGITGENVPRELQALVKDLPAVLEEVGKDAEKLEEQIQLYTAFTHFVCDWSEPVLPMLTFAQKRGNPTFYEWRTGKAPTVVERPVEEEAPPETLAEDSIDWGNFGTSAAAPGVNAAITVEDGINWGISLEPSFEDSGAIDWGDSEAAPIEIEIVDAGSDCPEGVARGEDALSVLENPQSRSQFIDELMELETFLTHRVTEMGEDGDVVAMSQFQMAPSILQGQTRQHVREMLAQVLDLLGRLTSLRMQHLFTIQASPGYVERVSELLRQKLKQADILVLKGATMVEKRQEALEEQSRLEPRVDLLAGRTRELQKMIEADISKRYHKRPVNLMGVNI